MSIDNLSPEPMNRSVAALGVKVPSVWLSGAGGACGTPLFVMNAKFAGSSPTVLRQLALFTTPVFRFWFRLKMAIAAHHLLASQLTPGGHGAQPGG
jgi:hypothetical protein